jgi:hypothetical protein
VIGLIQACHKDLVKYYPIDRFVLIETVR